MAIGVAGQGSARFSSREVLFRRTRLSASQSPLRLCGCAAVCGRCWKMVRRAAAAGDARVYDISGNAASLLKSSLAIGARATAAEKRARRKAELEKRETELLQHFEFPTICNRVKQSFDSTFLFACGTYPPQIHVYDTDQLSLKFKRHVDNDIVDFQILESDWRKFALLTTDRYIDLHSPFGSHFRTRVPRAGRDLMLHPGTCDLFVCGAGASVWRLNLEQGRFLAPLETVAGAQKGGGVNVCAINPTNRLLAFGGDNGVVDIWDPRILGTGAKPVGVLDVEETMRMHSKERITVRGKSLEVTAIRFDDYDGCSMALGTSSGHVSLFDLRSSRPLRIRDQGYGTPIRSIRLHSDGNHVISADVKSIKVWERETGVNRVAIEPDADINHLCVLGSSGVMCAAVEAPRVRSYYVPALGPAPKWCAFLDAFTEELEDDAGRKRISTGVDAVTGDAVEHEEEEVYENYKFVPAGELEGLGLQHLVGTEMLKPYMHGFFVHSRLYQRALSASEPFAYEKYKKERAREKIEKQRESRIGKVRAKRRAEKITVNKKLAQVLEGRRAQSRKGATGADIVNDPRFAAMFENKDFAVDETAERFVQLNPSGLADPGRKNNEDDSDEDYLEQFTLIDEEKDGAGKQASDYEDSISESSDESEGEEEEHAGRAISKRPRAAAEKKTSRTRMFAIDDAAEVLGQTSVHKRSAGRASRATRENVPLGMRVERDGSGPQTGGARGGRGRRGR